MTLDPIQPPRWFSAIVTTATALFSVVIIFMILVLIYAVMTFPS